MRLRDLSFLESNLIAHRGFFDNANGIPENSMIAFERAIENSYIIELDVHLLKDGKIVVFHDDNLGRMTGVDKKIKDFRWDNMNKLLTVFTPAYNRAHTLNKCYESLKRQTCKDFKWLIIDDGSTDNTKELVERWKSENNDFEIKYIYQKNQGMHGAHNTAYENIDT